MVVLGRVASSTIQGVVCCRETVYTIGPVYRRGVMLYKAGPSSKALG